MKINSNKKELILYCPYPDCNIGIEIIEINCAIFRCGVYKHNGLQIEPHLPNIECERIKKGDKIWGCGRPFQLIDGKLVRCDYL
jgi:hypothetical protein